jgi:hypothetical protein
LPRLPSRRFPRSRLRSPPFATSALFDDAARLKPEDARILGFAAGFTMTEASIAGDEKALRRGYYRMKEAVAAFRSSTSSPAATR